MEKYLLLHFMEFQDGNWKLVWVYDASFDLKRHLKDVPAAATRIDLERYRYEIFKAAGKTPN